MTDVVAALLSAYPHLTFTPGKAFSWSPGTQEIFFVPGKNGKAAAWSLLHETGHALLNHRVYRSDFELLKMEVAAWAQAQKIGKSQGIIIPDGHIQDCLDTYRDWLYRRSLCPNCSISSPQESQFSYRCYNCWATWRVSPSRFCRTYRSTQSKKPLIKTIS